MAAETLQGTRAKPGFPVAGSGPALNMKVAYGSFNIAAVVEVGDIFEICKLPAGAVVVGGYFYGADIDTGTETLDMDVGWKANTAEITDTDGFGNFGVLDGDVVAQIKPEVSIWYPLGGVLRTAGPKKFTAETTIQLYVNAVSNAGHVGIVTVVVHYVMDPAFSV